MEKKRYIDTNRILAFSGYLLITIFNVFWACFIRRIEFVQWTQVFSLIVILEFIVHFVTFKICKIKITSVYALISLFSYLFQFGATIVYAFGINRNLWNLRFNFWASQAAYIRSNTIAFGCLVCFTIGGLLVNLSNKRQKLDIRIYHYERYALSYYRFLGYALIIICFPLYLYMTVYSLNKITNAGTYTALAEQSLPGYITSFAKFIYVGIMVLIYYYHERNNKSLYIVFSGVFMMLIGVQMMFGSRSEPTTILFAFVIFYFNCIKTEKIKFRYFVLIALVAFILANFLYSIQISRNSGFSIQDVLIRFFSNGISVILYEFEEFGGSSLTTMTVIDRVSVTHPSWFFIKELLSLSPISISSKYSTVGSVYVNAYELGTTFVGEIFFYFGNWCFLASFLMALYISVIEKKIYSMMQSRNLVIFFMCLMWMWQEINCIRASFNLGIKTFIYSFVLFTGIRWIYNSFKHEVH